MAKIGLVDVDNYMNLGNCFPNLALMKLAAWHKQQGDEVTWYEPIFTDHFDIVYMSKVFSFTADYPYMINADKVIKGGTGYCISLQNGKEVFDKNKNTELPIEIEHIYPDYSLYNIKNTAYGYLTRGCPRGCGFCIVAPKEGKCSRKVADLTEFWKDQKNIVLLDPNILACKDCTSLLQQLAESKASVDFTQGLDIRLMTAEKAELIKQIKVKQIHFAFDRYQDKNIIMEKLKVFKDITKWDRHKVSCYVLCNYDTTMDQNLERINYLRSLDFNPYVMLYNKEHIAKGSELRKLQRYVNNKFIFWSCDSFENYKKGNYSGR